MRGARRAAAGALLVGAALVAIGPARGAITIDDFEARHPSWTAHPSDGVELALRSDAGRTGRALRLDFDFQGHAGYAVIRKRVALELPENYRFTFAVRGESPSENLEFKLVDSTGDNVWWCNRRDFAFPTGWQVVTTRRRQIQFAWGLKGGGEIRRVAAIEIAITAGSGGRGRVWIDDLALEEMPARAATAIRPRVTASSSLGGYPPEAALDTLRATSWRSLPGDSSAWIALDFQGSRELGGLVVDWEPGLHAADYDVEVSPDGRTWEVARSVRGGNGGRDYLFLPDMETRYLRLHVRGRAGRRAYGIRALTVQPVEWSESPNALFQTIARDAPRGRYPRAFRGEQVYWTVVGAEADDREALVSEDAALEPWKGGPSLEPFLFADGRLLTWADGRNEQTLADGWLPIPSVLWHRGAFDLQTTAFVAGPPGSASVYLRYRVRNRDSRTRTVTLFLAVRPFQVNPPTQFLNSPGGAVTLASVTGRGSRAEVGGVFDSCGAGHVIRSITRPSGFGGTRFDEGEIVEHLARGVLPGDASVSDPSGKASAAFAYRLEIPSGQVRDVYVTIPLCRADEDRATLGADGARLYDEARAACGAAWRKRAAAVGIELPGAAAAVVRTLEAQLAYLLINADGAALQPGSRAYERSWIRDGALMSSVLLRLGAADVVRSYLAWYAARQFADGKVPCCVDRRGADPVPEHDSDGEFLFLAAAYLRYTGDQALVDSLWPRIASAAAYLDSLRQLGRTDEYRAPERAVFFGLLPPSISHEGYSAKPMHSYWDDFWALKGFRDAAWMAEALGRPGDAARYRAIGQEFERELRASIQAAVALHEIDYVPGCADLGDFDATSTAIAIAPCEVSLPPAGVPTFERYWEFFESRRAGRRAWSDLTPYEMRVMPVFVRFGRRDRSQDMLRFFLSLRRPAGWAQWAEVVGREARAPRFIGDMPHSWIGAEYARAVLDMLAFEADSTLVLAAGVPPAWARGTGLAVRRLRTSYGALSYTLRAVAGGYEMRIDEGVRVPPGGLRVQGPFVGAARVSVNGRRARVGEGGAIEVRSLPAVVRAHLAARRR